MCVLGTDVIERVMSHISAGGPFVLVWFAAKDDQLSFSRSTRSSTMGIVALEVVQSMEMLPARWRELG